MELFTNVSDIYFDDDKIVPLHPPTLLYPLEPFGVGTASCESLDSYMLRLADAHCVSPSALHQLVLAPLLSHQSRGWRFNCMSNKKRPGAYNGFGLMPKTLAAALVKLTGIEQVRNCCLTGIAHLFSWQNFFRQEGVFCPACLEGTSDYTKYYHRLLWAISAAEACPVHKLTLVPHTCGCNTKRLHGLRRKMLFGICSQCGSIGYKCGNASRLDASPVQIWRATQIGELIAHTPSFYGLFSNENMTKGITAVIDILGQGYLTPAARAAGINKSVLWGWLNNKFKPSLYLLLNLCGAADVSLLSVMKGAPEKSGQPGAGVLERKMTALRLPKLSYEEKEDALRKALHAEVPTSLSCLAKELGISEKVLRQAFPTMARKIVERWKHHRASLTAAKLNNTRIECNAAIRELKRNGKSLTHRNLEMQVNRSILPSDPLYKAFRTMISSGKL